MFQPGKNRAQQEALGIMTLLQLRGLISEDAVRRERKQELAATFILRR